MKFLQVVIAFLIFCIVSSYVIEEVGGKSELPLLLRTLRLRTFSLKDGEYGYVPRVHLKQLRLRPTRVGSGDFLEDVSEERVGIENDSEAEDGRSRVARGLEAVEGAEDGFRIVKVAEVDGEERFRVVETSKVDGDARQDELGLQQASEADGDVAEEKPKSPTNKLPGWGQIGRHRHPKTYSHKVLPYPVPRVDGAGRIHGLRGPPRRRPVSCQNKDLEQVRKCFKHYFKNFDIFLVDDKLPQIAEVHDKMSRIQDFEENRRLHEEFEGCFRSTPVTCYESRNLKKIILDPEEADIYSAFFTSSHFMFKSEKSQKLVNCFLEHLESIPSIKEEDDEEVKKAKCTDARLKIHKARNDFRSKCEHLEPSEGQIEKWLVPFVRRQSIGQFCPRLTFRRKP